MDLAQLQAWLNCHWKVAKELQLQPLPLRTNQVDQQSSLRLPDDHV